MQVELFHSVAEPGSARARKLVIELGLEALVRFRNVVYPEVAADLRRHGGAETPALWDGNRLTSGAEAVAAQLERLAGPRS
jgi:hypothetical protein